VLVFDESRRNRSGPSSTPRQTDLSISFAGSVDVPVSGGTARVEVAPQRGPRGIEQVQVADTPFLEVRIVDRAVEFRKSKEQIPML